jgi:hypothetical protein
MLNSNRRPKGMCKPKQANTRDYTDVCISGMGYRKYFELKLRMVYHEQSTRDIGWIVKLTKSSCCNGVIKNYNKAIIRCQTQLSILKKEL